MPNYPCQYFEMASSAKTTDFSPIMPYGPRHPVKHQIAKATGALLDTPRH